MLNTTTTYSTPLVVTVATAPIHALYNQAPTLPSFTMLTFPLEIAMALKSHTAAIIWQQIVNAQNGLTNIFEDSRQAVKLISGQKWVKVSYKAFMDKLAISYSEIKGSLKRLVRAGLLFQLTPKKDGDTNTTKQSYYYCAVEYPDLAAISGLDLSDLGEELAQYDEVTKDEYRATRDIHGNSSDEYRATRDIGAEYRATRDIHSQPYHVCINHDSFIDSFKDKDINTMVDNNTSFSAENFQKLNIATDAILPITMINSDNKLTKVGLQELGQELAQLIGLVITVDNQRSVAQGVLKCLKAVWSEADTKSMPSHADFLRQHKQDALLIFTQRRYSSSLFSLARAYTEVMAAQQRLKNYQAGEQLAISEYQAAFCDALGFKDLAELAELQGEAAVIMVNNASQRLIARGESAQVIREAAKLAEDAKFLTVRSLIQTYIKRHLDNKNGAKATTVAINSPVEIKQVTTHRRIA